MRQGFFRVSDSTLRPTLLSLGAWVNQNGGQAARCTEQSLGLYGMNYLFSFLPPQSMGGRRMIKLIGWYLPHRKENHGRGCGEVHSLHAVGISGRGRYTVLGGGRYTVLGGCLAFICVRKTHFVGEKICVWVDMGRRLSQ